MSTSSKYSPNKLKQVVSNNTEHFIIKSYITAKFECHIKKTEYHLYWYNKNAGMHPESMRYKCLSSKKMGKNEIKYFSSIINDYRAEIDSDDGAVWINKSIGFNKSNVIITQMILWP
jgi:hypothetical protein